MCPLSRHPSLSLYSSSWPTYCLKEKQSTITLWVVTGAEYPIGWSSRNSCRFWSSVVLTRELPIAHVRQPPCVADATSGSKRGDGRARRNSARSLRSYDRIIGLELSDIGVDCCITKAPCGGERAGKSPVDRGKWGTKRSTVVDADGIPLGVISAPANRHDSSLLSETLDTLKALGSLPERVSVHLDRGYDSEIARGRLTQRALIPVISKKGKTAPVQATKRWVVERTNAWHNAHKKLVWCTERRGRVIDFWIAFSNAILIVRRLIRKAWTRYRWATRPSRKS